MLQWSRFLVKCPEWGHLVKLMEQTAQEAAGKANKPMQATMELIQVGGQQIPVAVDGMTQLAQREYHRGVKDALLMMRDTPNKLIDFYEEMLPELRYKVQQEDERLDKSKATSQREGVN